MSQLITIIGTGNVASHLAPALEDAGHKIEAVYGRSQDRARLLGDRLNNPRIADNLDFTRNRSTLFIIAVSDNAIEKVASDIALPKQAVLAHTSGTTPLSSLDRPGLENTGVFYPLQTFSRQRDISFEGLPLLIEASNAFTDELLSETGESLKAWVSKATSEDRQGIHLAAMFANNFTNHMLDIAGRIMKQGGLDENLLKPLIRETVEKAMTLSPASAQTGPAVRGDTNTIQRHIRQLEYNPVIQELYRLISRSIAESKPGG